jgi:multidrug efflux pump subunit AcrA (membrane-fusion protein)
MKHKKIIIGTCIAVAAAVGAASVSVSAGTAIETATAVTGQLDCELELNGKVESLSEKSYYSKINGRIGTVHVKEGDLVKAGDMLISYDTEDLSLDEMLAELDAAADQGGYDDSKQYGGRVAGLYSEAKNSLPELEQQIQTTEAVIIMTRQALNDRQSELNLRGAQLEADLACCVAGKDDDPEE